MKYALTNMVILNGHKDMTPEKGKAIIVDGEKISAIVDEQNVPADCFKVDLGGKYLLPGLINLHVHLGGSGKPKKGKTDYVKLAKLLKLAVARKVIYEVGRSNALKALMSGTTTIRAVGGVMDFDTRLRDNINSGKTVGPRILAADYAVSVPGGHMTGSVALPTNSPEEAAQMVEDIAKFKPDVIKLMITGGVLDAEVPGEPGILKMPAEYVKAACDKAHELGFPVAAHVESAEGMRVALKNGVDTIEHGGKPEEDVMQLFKESGKVLVGTISPAIPFAVMDKEVCGLTEMDFINGTALYKNIKDCMNACLEMGITVGLGTDAGCPYTTHYAMWRELWYFAKCCNVSNAFAIHTATEINASIAGISDITGTVDEGKSADFMIVSENPLDDLTALRKADAVVIRGEMIDKPVCKKYDLVEENLDKVMPLI